MSGKVVRRGIHVVAARPSKRHFRVGQTVPASGIYKIFHAIHRVSHEATLLKGELFPPCNRCSDKVRFELQREIEIDSGYEFRVRLFQIPHPEAKGEAEEETA